MEETECKHENYACAGYPIEYFGVKGIQVQTIYDIYCPDCDHFVSLLTGKYIDDKGLTSPLH